MKKTLIALAVLGLPNAAVAADAGNPVVLDVPEASYGVGEDIEITISGGPVGGMAFWLFDFAPGPATFNGIGPLEVGLTQSVFLVPLPPIVDGFTFSCGGIDCDYPLLNAPLYMQVVVIGPDGTPCLSNGAVLRVVDGGNCELTGCTPGYWKNHPETWGPTGYSPDDDYDTVFRVNIFDPDQTLLEVLQPPAIVEPLEFHSVAALLNASHPDHTYPFAPSIVIHLTANAFTSGNAQLIEDQKDTFDIFNNENCVF